MRRATGSGPVRCLAPDRGRLRSGGPRARRPRECARLSPGTISHMTAAELERVAEELELDVVGAAPASAYGETERHIHERAARGLFADMKFTMAHPEVSCHPETLLEDARTVVSAAYSYYAPEPALEERRGTR